MDWLGCLNFVLLQWFGVRFAWLVDEDDGQFLGTVWMVGVLPLTGWWSKYRGPYRYVGAKVWRGWK